MKGRKNEKEEETKERDKRCKLGLSPANITSFHVISSRTLTSSDSRNVTTSPTSTLITFLFFFFFFSLLPLFGLGTIVVAPSCLKENLKKESKVDIIIREVYSCNSHSSPTKLTTSPSLVSLP